MPIPTCSVTQVKCRKVKDPALTGLLDTYDSRLATLESYVNKVLANYVNNGGLTSDVQDIIARTVIADTIITNLLVSNTVITQSLYATYGDIAELTVDYLLTINKLARYWAGDTSDVNYIKAHEQTYEVITGAYASGTVHHTDRNGNKLYYKSGPVTAANYKLVGMSATPSGYPVYVYDYDEQIKMIIGHVYNSVSGNYEPQIIMGAGTGVSNNDKYFMTKSEDEMKHNYIDDSGNEISLTFAKGGTIKALGNTGTGLTLRNIAIGSTAPSNPQDGDLWIDTSGA